VTVRKSAVLLFGVIGAGFVALDTAGAQQGETAGRPRSGTCSRTNAQLVTIWKWSSRRPVASRQAWTDTVDEMVRYGARIDPQDRPRIVEYLSSVLSPARRRKSRPLVDIYTVLVGQTDA